MRREPEPSEGSVQMTDQFLAQGSNSRLKRLYSLRVALNYVRYSATLRSYSSFE